MRTVITILLVALVASAAPAAAHRVRIVCRDGVVRAPAGQPAWRPTCDFDGARDGVCRFAFACPLCTFGSPGCKAKCLDEPRTAAVRLPVGARRHLRLPAVDVDLELRCAPGAGT